MRAREIGDGSDFGGRSGHGPATELPPFARTNREAGLRLPKNPTKWLRPEPAENKQEHRVGFGGQPPPRAARTPIETDSFKGHLPHHATPAPPHPRHHI